MLFVSELTAHNGPLCKEHGVSEGERDPRTTKRSVGKDQQEAGSLCLTWHLLSSPVRQPMCVLLAASLLGLSPRKLHPVLRAERAEKDRCATGQKSFFLGCLMNVILGVVE